MEDTATSLVQASPHVVSSAREANLNRNRSTGALMMQQRSGMVALRNSMPYLPTKGQEIKSIGQSSEQDDLPESS